MPRVDVGDRFAAPCCEGVVDYTAPGIFRVLLTQVPMAVSGGLTREATAGAGTGEIAIATFNVENLDPGDGEATFARLARIIVDDLGSPDLIALEEVQDRNGAVNDTVVDATATFAMLAGAVVDAGGPCYLFRQIDPLDGRDGGEPGGNIRQGFLVREDRGLQFVDRPGGDAITAIEIDPGPVLSLSPGRIDPAHPAFTDSAEAFSASRKPLVGEFTFNGHRLFVIANHFSSKGGDEPLFGRRQPPALPSEEQRSAQAQVVRAFVDELLDEDPAAQVVVLGDLNDFAFSPPLEILTEGGSPERDLYNLIETLPVEERYSYIFVGNAQTLDHILLSASLVESVVDFDVVHVNAEFADQASDHDPQVVRLALAPDGPPAPATVSPAGSCP